MSKLAALALASLAILAAPASADLTSATPQPISIDVSAAGLDLTRDAGVDRLAGRLVVAMERACGARPIPREIKRTELWAACRASLRPSSTDLSVGIAFERARARMN